jgi:hypothetical protein
LRHSEEGGILVFAVAELCAAKEDALVCGMVARHINCGCLGLAMAWKGRGVPRNRVVGIV